MAADECENQGLELASPSEETLSFIKGYLPPWAKVNNPMDIEPLFETVGPANSVRIPLEVALEDPNVDSIAILFAAVPRLIPVFDIKNVITQMMDRHHRQRKPILTHLIGFKETVDSWTTALEEEGILVYPSIERCIKALGALWKYQSFKKQKILEKS
jgi:acyl-CoA synthetase (NDP forming)